jgi:hypothetical protein
VPVDAQLDLPEGATVHYVTAHLHPFGESVELFDKTEGRVIFTIRSKDLTGRRGVAEMDRLSLPEGVPLDRDHEYELVTRYHNPTSGPVDAMSILYLYMLDRKFEAQHLRSSSPSAMSR